MKIILISILYISLPCFAENSWPQDHEKSIPSLLDPSRPYIDTKAEENKYLENISEQIKEQEKETPALAPEVQPSEDTKTEESVENTETPERTPASTEEDSIPTPQE